MSTLSPGFETKRRTTERPAPNNPAVRWSGPAPSNGITGTKSPREVAHSSLSPAAQLVELFTLALHRGSALDRSLFARGLWEYKRHHEPSPLDTGAMVKALEGDRLYRKLKADVEDHRLNSEKYLAMLTEIAELGCGIQRHENSVKDSLAGCETAKDDGHE